LRVHIVVCPLWSDAILLPDAIGCQGFHERTGGRGYHAVFLESVYQTPRSLLPEYLSPMELNAFDKQTIMLMSLPRRMDAYCAPAVAYPSVGDHLFVELSGLGWSTSRLKRARGMVEGFGWGLTFSGVTHRQDPLPSALPKWTYPAWRVCMLAGDGDRSPRIPEEVWKALGDSELFGELCLRRLGADPDPRLYGDKAINAWPGVKHLVSIGTQTLTMI